MEDGLRYYGANDSSVFSETIRHVVEDVYYDDVLTAATKELGKTELVARIMKLRDEVVKS